MHEFDRRTKRERLPVLRLVALAVLRSHYGIEPRRLRLVSLSFNTIFRVDRVDGPPLALRVCGRERIHAAGVEEIEAAWLDAIADDLGWAVPRVVRTIFGDAVVAVEHPTVPRPVPCSLFSWVPGVSTGDGLDASTAAGLGVILSRLHGHASTLAADGVGPMAPAVLTPELAAAVRADRVVYFGSADDVESLIPGDSMLGEAVRRADEELAALWQRSATPHLLHGDFGPSNVLRWRNRLTPIDFQDLQLGHAVQDVGLTIADLLDDGVDPAVVDAFRHGVEDAGGPAITDEEIAGLRAMRELNLIGFALASPRPGLDGSIADSVEVVRQWMRPT